MATLAVRNLDAPLKSHLRLLRAAAQNQSMQKEARQILRAALHEPLHGGRRQARPTVKRSAG